MLGSLNSVGAQPLRRLARTTACLATLLATALCLQTPAVAGSREPEVGRARTADGGAELACLAEAIYFEARGTGAAGEEAVAHVVVNRTRERGFPSSVCGVVRDGCQFSYRCDGRADTLSDPKARARAYKTAATVLAGDANDITRGAIFFHSAKAPAGWFKSRPRVGTIGGNVFYR